MFNKLFVKLGLILFLTTVFFAIAMNWNFVKIYAHSQDILKIDPPEVTLNKKNNFKETIELKDVDSFDISNIDTSCAEICTPEVKADKKIEFTIKEAFLKTIQFKKEETIEKIKVTYTKDGKKLDGSVTLKIEPRITDVSIKAGTITLSNTDPIKLVENDPTDIQVTYKQDGDELSVFKLKSVKNEFASPDGNKVIPNSPGSTEIIVLVNEDVNSEIGRFKVTVIPSIKTLTAKSAVPIFMSDETTALLELSAKGAKDQEINDFDRVKCSVVGDDLNKILSLANNGSSFTLTAKKLLKSTAETGQITCNIDDKKANEASPLTVFVTIQPKKGYLTIDSLNGNTLLPNGSLTFLVNVYNEIGTPQTAGIVYQLENEPLNKQWVSLSPQGSKLNVNWVNLSATNSEATRPSFVSIKVLATNLTSGSYPITGTITVRMGGTVTRFSSLKVKLNVMDSGTAKDLYGGVTNNEYYVLMVRLFNDLKDDDPNKNLGQSILAYSSSIELAVGLEKQYDKKLDSGIEVWDKDKVKKEKVKWQEDNQLIIKESLPEVKERYKKLIDVFNKFMRESAEKELIALQLEIQTKTDKTKNTQDEAKKARREADTAYKKAYSLREKLRTYYQDNLPPLQPFTPRSDVAVDDGKWYPATRDDLIKIAQQDSYLSDEDDDSTTSFKDNEPNCVDTITYRPFTFEMMVNTVDRREERTRRSRLFKVLNFVSFGLSTITAVAVPAKGSDLPLAIEKFGNVAIPGLEELYPNLKEQHRQNIVAQAMKTIEEIPFGSDLTRVIFIPKKAISGLITGQKVRISQLCPFYFKVKVAVITKGGEVTLGGQQTK